MALIDSLESYWKLDEASGNAVDAHGSNTLTDANTVGSGAGKINNARDFELSNSEFFSTGDNASLSVGDIDFSFQVWVNLESKATVQIVLSKWGVLGTDLSHEYLLYYNNSTDRFNWAVTSGGTDATITQVTANNFGAPSTATWHCIHCWHDATANQIGISVNAGTADTASHSGGVFSGNSDFALGAYHSAALFYFDGLMDEVGFWKRVLTSGERTELYNGGAGLAYPFTSGTTTRGIPFGTRGTAFNGGRCLVGLVR